METPTPPEEDAMSVCPCPCVVAGVCVTHPKPKHFDGPVPFVPSGSEVGFPSVVAGDPGAVVVSSFWPLTDLVSLLLPGGIIGFTRPFGISVLQVVSLQSAVFTPSGRVDTCVPAAVVDLLPPGLTASPPGEAAVMELLPYGACGVASLASNEASRGLLVEEASDVSA